MEFGHQFASCAAPHTDPEGFRYEGAEKTLEVYFSGLGDSLRAIPRSVWDDILDHACCRILSKTSTESVDAYVLSESSLFVYDWRLYLKTCGQTTLLKCLPPLIEAVEKTIGGTADWMRFSHKNFVFPEDQKFPHVSFEQEARYCLTHCATTQTSAHVLGDLLSDHWNVLYVDFQPNLSLRSPSPASVASSDSATTQTQTDKGSNGTDNQASRATALCDYEGKKYGDNVINVMMYGMERDVCAHFFEREGETNQQAGNRALHESGIAQLFDSFSKGDILLDHYMFSPCGFSLNALIQGEYYATIHIAPEDDVSYASFETNFPLGSYDTLLQRVLDVFKPERCTVAIFSDTKLDDSATQLQQDGKRAAYRRVNHGSAKIQNMFYAEMSSLEQCSSTSSSVCSVESAGDMAS